MAKHHHSKKIEKSSASSQSSKATKKHIPTHIIPPRTYKPYQTTSLETPLWHLILQPLCLSCLRPVLASLYRLRGMVAHPMRINIVPNFIACLLPAHLASTAVGDLILLVPILVFILRGAHYTFIAPSLELGGYMSAYCIFVAYLTANKSNSLFTWLFGIPYERLIGLHWFSSVAGVVLGTFHCYVSFVFGGDDNGDSRFSKAVGSTPDFGKFLFDGVNNWSGTILLDAMGAMVLMSFFQFLRRYAFNIWYFLHMVFGILILVMLFLHSVPSAAFVTAWWALDLLVRYAVMAGLKNVTRARLRVIGTQHRGKTARLVELIVEKPAGFQYNAGQFVRLAVPAISTVEFHAISIASAPDEEYIILQVRKLGDWTERLCQLAETTDFTDVLLEGPYGAMSIDLEDDNKYTMVLCVSGGIGVTPCQSVGKHLLLKHRQEGRRLKKLNFVWAVRDLQMVEDIPPLFLGATPTTKDNSEAAQIEEDYSKSSPEYQRMMERSDYFRSSKFDEDLRTPHASGFELLRRPAVVQADIYCTQQKLANDIERANATISLPYNLCSGRPDLDKIFEEMKESAIAMGETNVAVIGCGPAKLIDAVQEACRKHSSSVLLGACGDDSVFFDFHKEHFEL
ncbi:unnamed protein product [Cylindrotheca closterium]|uniref:FAD-binding FR-type domain-containing protein n=1 Tax=Cylindrotheca closterium TaxID=2856 RepID=A0AAD2CM47_9STRA|nr:unnamed protein product [Cylindrotheca closterium]